MKADDIKSIGILGAGMMGGGIAQSAVLAGYPVIIRDLKDDYCEQARNIIMDGPFGFRKAVERGKLSADQVEAAMGRLRFTTKLEDLQDCDYIIEAIGEGQRGGQLEDKAKKLAIFTELDKAIKPEAVFASNTSKFTIADLAAVTGRKDRFIGTHLFSPANIMKLVEVTHTEDTREDVVTLTEDLFKKMGKVPIRVKDVPGDTAFVANRIMFAVRKEAQAIVDAGIATEEAVDLAVTLGFKWPVGPFSLSGRAKKGWDKKQDQTK